MKIFFKAYKPFLYGNLSKFSTFSKSLSSSSYLSNKFNFYRTSSCFISEDLRRIIKLVDTDDFKENKNIEKWGEELIFYLEKEKYKEFEKNFQFCSENDIILSATDVNSLLSLIFDKNEKLIDIVYEYILDKNIEMDSMSFYYLIMSALNFNSFVKAYNLFVQSTIFNVPQNLTVIISLYKNLQHIKDKEYRKKCKSFVDNHVTKYYNVDVDHVINNLFGFDDDGSDNDKDNSEVNFKGSDRNKENSNGKDKSTGRQANFKKKSRKTKKRQHNKNLSTTETTNTNADKDNIDKDKLAGKSNEDSDKSNLNANIINTSEIENSELSADKDNNVITNDDSKSLHIKESHDQIKVNTSNGDGESLSLNKENNSSITEKENKLNLSTKPIADSINSESVVEKFNTETETLSSDSI